MSSRFSSNSEAYASELLENLEDIFPLYYMDSDIVRRFKYSTTHWRVIRRDLCIQTLTSAFCVKELKLIYSNSSLY